eukprot:CAMPEP_0203683656 /NCGR_PEP_ID=MMETSP0090-20130426/47637_1 /ASSEMBLY_ACC=CAM_ASM_001088 /TAXON_ID=426623 /ORGANISM="Chaetoceros affinis, Strain CCMP159" /LENGTH=153 /DNA_ID=CAMNT_0050552811 /DNA_START=477 /DNA_END=938 /DNA_ORIENTATION=+
MPSDFSSSPDTFDENFLSDLQDLDVDDLDVKPLSDFQLFEDVFNTSTIGTETIHVKMEQKKSVVSRLSPLLNILLSHPNVKHFASTTNYINLMAVKEELEKNFYNSVDAVEKDLYDIFSNISGNYNNNDDVERISKDFLALVTNYCRGISYAH